MNIKRGIFTILMALILAVPTILPAATYYPGTTCTDQSGATTGCTGTMLTGIGSSKDATIVFRHNTSGNTTTYTFTASSVTFPKNVTVQVEPGVRLSIASGKTLTFNGPFKADGNTVFTGSGTVSFGVSSVDCVKWQWFGAFPDGATAYTTQIQAAIDAAGANVPSCPSSGTWVTASPLYLRTNYRIKGAGRPLTIVKNTTTDGTALAISPYATSGSYSAYYVDVADMTFEGYNNNSNTQVGLDASGFRDSVFRNLTFMYHQYGIKMWRQFKWTDGTKTVGANPCYFNSFENILVTENQYGVYFTELDSAGENAQANANNFYNLNVNSANGLWTGRYGIYLAGNGNVFGGKTRIGGSSMTTGLHIQTISRNNVLQFLYIESSPTTGIHVDDDLGGRTNFVYGLHFDGSPATEIDDTRNSLTILSAYRNQLASPARSNENVGIRIAPNYGYAGESYRAYNIVSGQGDPSANPVPSGSLAVYDIKEDRIPFEIQKDTADNTLKTLTSTLSSSYVKNGGILLGSPSGGGMKVKFARELVTLTGASTATTFNIPSGVRLLGATFKVNTEVTGDGSTWSAAFSGGSTTSLVTGKANAADTKANAQIADAITTNTTNVTISPNTGSFSGGTITVIVYYTEMEDQD